VIDLMKTLCTKCASDPQIEVKLINVKDENQKSSPTEKEIAKIENAKTKMEKILNIGIFYPIYLGRFEYYLQIIANYFVVDKVIIRDYFRSKVHSLGFNKEILALTVFTGLDERVFPYFL
jgi:hypothetical protein